MKRYILLLFLLLPALLIKSQYVVTISGQIHDNNSSIPAAFHPLVIAATTSNSQVYFNSLETDQDGFYFDTFQVPNGITGTAFVVTPDCQYFIHDTVMFFSANNCTFNCNFSICLNPPSGCYANYTYNFDTVNPYLVHFNNASTGDFTEVRWDFGDGHFSNDLNPQHIYTPGTYQACLKVYNTSTSCSDSICHEIVVDPGYDCKSLFSYQLTDYACQFTGASNSPYTTEYFWDFGGGTILQGKTIQYNFEGPGDYYVQLRTLDTYGCEWISGQTIHVEEVVQCNANYSYMVDPENYTLMHFVNSSTANATEYLWDFGDGNISNEQNPSHNYAATGTYQVCLEIRVNEDCSDIQCQDVTIAPNNYFVLAGQVFASGLLVDTLEVHLYREKDGIVSMVDSAAMGMWGIYYFYGLPAGNYMVKASLHPSSQHYGQFMPTYTGNTTQWTSANILTLDHDIYNADIALLNNPQLLAGNGGITGSIFYDFNHENFQSIPAYNVAIYLCTPDNEIKRCAFSNEDGFFEFNDVPFGNYSLAPEITGKYAIPLSFELDQLNDSIGDINFTIKDMTITHSIAELGSAFVSSVSDVYPNPVTDLLYVTLTGQKPSNLLIGLSDLSGRQLLNKNQQITQGLNTIELNLENLGKGVYMLTMITSDGYSLSRKIVKN